MRQINILIVDDEASLRRFVGSGPNVLRSQRQPTARRRPGVWRSILLTGYFWTL